ncbi:MAG: ABC transporter permease [Bacteroidaceae bacterium]|jgi:putative ABC transport system permease protein|nr:ABC transporter permease [Bacteroidaceae bacterium]
MLSINETFTEITETISRNKSRSFLTGFGVFWGIFMLISMIGGGQGLKEKLQNNFAGFASNSAMLWAQPTTKAYKGFRKGRTWNMEYKDVDRLKHQMPELDAISPLISLWGRNAVRGDHSVSCSLKGIKADYSKIETPEIRYGRFLNDIDLQQGRKVCVIGKKIYETLFPGKQDPCGEMIRIDSIYYKVVGVDYNEGGISINGSAEESVLIPITIAQQAYNRGNSVDMIFVTGKPGITMSDILDKMRSVVARAHQVSPNDEQAVMVLNTEVMFKMIDNLFTGVNFLIWLVGIGTLLAGAIGVSNIMMVTVRERTTEIGIRRAIGATPANILTQIMSESVILTTGAGVLGILFGVLILNMVELGNTTDGILDAHFQVGFWTAILALILLIILGILAGLAPAARAMGIKPVDAMRDE